MVLVFFHVIANYIGGKAIGGINVTPLDGNKQITYMSK
jgi:hypothetical protein